MAEIVTDMDKVTEVDFKDAEWSDVVTSKAPQDGEDGDVDSMRRVERESLRPKFNSVAALKLHLFSLESLQDEAHGNAVDWHRWSALFRDVTEGGGASGKEKPAAILHTDTQGFVTAQWYGDGDEAERVWADLEKEWDAYDRRCEGHCDTDDALTSGVGIGEAVFCDGSCAQ